LETTYFTGPRSWPGQFSFESLAVSGKTFNVEIGWSTDRTNFFAGGPVASFTTDGVGYGFPYETDSAPFSLPAGAFLAIRLSTTQSGWWDIVAGGAWTYVSIVPNAAPVVTAASPPMSAITEDQTENGGDLVADIVAGSIYDADGNAVYGVAVHSLDSGNGVWQYSTNSGAIWQPVGAVSPAQALLLRAVDRLRFVPDGENGDTATVGYYAWDQTMHTVGDTADSSVRGGSTAFSTAEDTATIVVSAVNDAPVLSPGGPSMVGITEDDIDNAGMTMTAILGVSVADVDNSALEGMAIHSLASGNGRWQYSTDNGTSWNDIGSVSTAQAMLLRHPDRVRFVPDEKNADNATVSYYAWDQTAGTPGTKANATTRGGTNSFSTAGDTASINVTGVNDAPFVNLSISPQYAVETVPFSYTFPSNTFQDVDLGDSLEYESRQADGSALPPWLAFTPASRTFSGTPGVGEAGTLLLDVTCSDTNGATATNQCTMTTDHQLRVAGLSVSNGVLLVECTGGNSFTQYIDSTESLFNPWVCIRTNYFPGTITNLIQLNVSTNAQQFFRLRLNMQ